MKPVMGHLRAQGFMSVDYLDDILLIGKDYEECQVNVKETKSLLESLGFILNESKCKLSPARQCKFLGFEIDSHSYRITLPNEKKLNILKLIENTINKPKIRIREFAQ